MWKPCTIKRCKACDRVNHVEDGTLYLAVKDKYAPVVHPLFASVPLPTSADPEIANVRLVPATGYGVFMKSIVYVLLVLESEYEADATVVSSFLSVNETELLPLPPY